MLESDTQHRQPLGPLPWVRLALVSLVNAFSVSPKPKSQSGNQTETSPSRAVRAFTQSADLNGGQGRNRTTDTQIST
jgi:hypothetical protein